MRLFWTGFLILALRAILENVKSGLQGAFQGFDVKLHDKGDTGGSGAFYERSGGFVFGVSKVKNSGLEITMFYTIQLCYQK